MIRRAIALFAVILTSSACSAAPAATTAAPTSSPTAGPTASPTTAGSTSAPVATTPAASPSPAPATATPAAIDVATVLPPTLGGTPLETVALSGDALDDVFFGGLTAIGNTLDVDPASMNVVVGRSGGLDLVTVVQVPGADTAALMDAVKFGVSPFQMAAGKLGTPTTIGGKEVQAFSGTFGGQPVTTYIYVVGDVIFVVGSGTTPHAAEELFAALP